MEKQEVGVITHYFAKISVAVVKLSAPLQVGDRISIEGPTTGVVEQNVGSMQIEHQNIETASVGQEVGLKTDGKVHEHDKVYKIV
ncbi:translation elongation factor-like protein [Candidatus Micrarchaeota archaeon]|nr:translation elongation factor-like protein [Candidatus Micrarchaeota archaeon]